MKQKLNDAIQVVDSKGKKLTDAEPQFLATNVFKLPGVPGRGKRKTLVPINLFLPPGISKFFIERIDASHARFVILTSEVNRISEKAENIMLATKEARNENDPKTRN